MEDPLDKAAKSAVDKHQRLLHSKTLELVLGSMIALDGVHATRQKLMWYYKHLEEFDNG